MCPVPGESVFWWKKNFTPQECITEQSQCQDPESQGAGGVELGWRGGDQGDLPVWTIQNLCLPAAYPIIHCLPRIWEGRWQFLPHIQLSLILPALMLMQCDSKMTVILTNRRLEKKTLWFSYSVIYPWKWIVKLNRIYFDLAQQTDYVELRVFKHSKKSLHIIFTKYMWFLQDLPVTVNPVFSVFDSINCTGSTGAVLMISVRCLDVNWLLSA
jgi:hypothetical protein